MAGMSVRVAATGVLLVGAGALVAFTGVSAGFLVLGALPLLLLPADVSRLPWILLWCLLGGMLGFLVAERIPGNTGLLVAVACFTAVGIVHGELLRRREAQRRKAAAELYELATHDGLTGALNRTCFEELARQETRRAARYGNPLSLAIIDLDDLKTINDHAGHRAGDDALRKLGGLLRESVRDCDSVGRLGGDEFALLMPETGLLAAAIACERLRLAVEGLPGNGGAAITASVGIAECEGEASRYETLYETADRCLYTAKRGGRNRVSTRPDPPASA